MDLRLKGRRCLVTGGSAGIGAGIVAALAAEGAEVLAVARRPEPLEQLAATIAHSGTVRPVTLAADLTGPGEVERVVQYARNTIGPPDILVNAAGYSMPVGVDAPDSVWDAAMDLNYTAVRRLSMALLPDMRRNGFGRIINLTSIMEPMILNATSPAKAAVHVWAKGLSRLVASEGVTINSIAPGRVDSEQVGTRLYQSQQARDEFIRAHIPAGRFGSPDEVAALALFLASPHAGYITGSIISVDGGMKYGL